MQSRLIRRMHASLASVALLLVLSASTAVAQTATVTAEWDRNTDTLTAGYVVYYGTGPGNYQWSVDVGNQVSAPLTLSLGSVYYVSVRAYNIAAQPGPPSNEATINLSGVEVPTAQITASLQNATTAIVSWQTSNAVGAVINGIPAALSGSVAYGISSTTTFTIVATSAGGATATHSTTLTMAPSPTIPSVPRAMSVATTPTGATLYWQTPVTGEAVAQYLLYVGTSPGGADLLNGLPIGNVLAVSGDLPKGRYYARVAAANGFGVSGMSNEVAFTVGRTLATPAGLAVQWVGSVAVLTWRAPAGNLAVEDQPTTYVVEAGTAPGTSNVANVSLGNVLTISAEIPSGTYYVRVRAQNTFGESAPTADLILTAPGAPTAPTALASNVSGSTVNLSWVAPAGAAATSYVIEAGSAPGLSDFGVLPVGNVTNVSAPVPPGTYYVRVRAMNARGVGPVSNEVIVVR